MIKSALTIFRLLVGNPVKAGAEITHVTKPSYATKNGLVYFYRIEYRFDQYTGVSYIRDYGELREKLKYEAGKSWMCFTCRVIQELIPSPIWFRTIR